MHDIEIERKRHGSILNTLFKEQFRLKLGVVYLFASGFNLLSLAFCYTMYKTGSYGLDGAIALYLISVIIYYKFFFKYSKDGKQYQVLVFRLWGDVKTKTEKKLRENLAEKSARILEPQKMYKDEEEQGEI